MAAISPNTYIEGFKKSMCDGIDGAFKKGVKHGRYLAMQEYLQIKEENAELKKRIGKDMNVPRWISVEDRLPDDDCNVLVLGVSDNESVIAITSYTHNMHGFGIEGWHPPWQYFFYNRKITHWMPLPEKPKEDTE